MEDDDDEFEDLFSFGDDLAKTPTVSDSRPKPTVGADPSSGDLKAASSTAATNNASAVDDFDDLFGTPPVTPASKGSVVGRNSVDYDEDAVLLDSMGVVEPGFGLDTTVDEDTRNLLDWLDDDAGKKTDGEGGRDTQKDTNDDGSSDGLSDDFDFDAMLADAEPTEKAESVPAVAPTPEVEAQDEKEVEQSTQEECHAQASQSGITGAEERQAVEPSGVSAPPDDAQISSADEAHSQPPSNAPAIAAATKDSHIGGKITPDVTSEPRNIEEDLAFDTWVDEEEDEQSEKESSCAVNDEMNASEDNCLPENSKGLVLKSLGEAIRSSKSTPDDVRSLFSRERTLDEPCVKDAGASDEDRMYLWSKLICGKVVNAVEEGSLAESYREWEARKEEIRTDDDFTSSIDSLLERACGGKMSGGERESMRNRVASLTYFHNRRKGGGPEGDVTIDPLIAPVALAILRAGFSPAAASVIMSHIEPSSMPLLRLSTREQLVAAKALHFEFYLLACYHLPLLIMHLDRHCPGWYWPESDQAIKVSESKDSKEEATHSQAIPAPAEVRSKKSDKDNGLVPLSWFVTNFAGQCGGKSSFAAPHRQLLPLWDHLLARGDHSWKYFLAIAILDKHSNVLLMSRGDELHSELEKILRFEGSSFSEETFVGMTGGGDNPDDFESISDWLASTKSLMESTPGSVLDLLRSADDRAVAKALKAKQALIDRELQAQHEAHESSLKKEREERDAEAKKAEIKARLVAYYRTVQPEKVETVDTIMKVFEGRLGVLNDKLKKKVCVAGAFLRCVKCFSWLDSTGKDFCRKRLLKIRWRTQRANSSTRSTKASTTRKNTFRSM